MSVEGYDKAPEGLAERVRDEVRRRLVSPVFRGALGVLDDAEMRGGAIEEIPYFALAARQHVSPERLHRLRKPASWGFVIELEPEGNKTLLASAGPVTGGGFQYSSILNLPEELFSARNLDGLRLRTGLEDVAVLQVPSYYLEALWFRSDNPETDLLLFYGNTFGIFPPLIPPFEPVTLSTFVKYLNDRLVRGDDARRETDASTAD